MKRLILIVALLATATGCNPVPQTTYDGMSQNEKLDELLKQLSRQDIRDPFADINVQTKMIEIELEQLERPGALRATKGAK